MKRNSLFSPILLLILSFSATLSYAATSRKYHHKSKTQQPTANLLSTNEYPNVVLVLFDDAGWGTFGQSNPSLWNMAGNVKPDPQSVMYTPNINNAMLRGITFKNVHSGSPLCTPSRASLVMGRRVDQTNVRSNDPVNNAINITYPTIATVFRDNGYQTVKLGKHALGIPGTKASPLACGYQNFTGYGTDREAHFAYPLYLWSNNGKKIYFPNNLKASVQTCAKPSKPCTYATDVFLEEFTRFVNNRNPKQPFYVELAPTQPHLAVFASAPNRFACLSPSYGQYAIKSWSDNQKGFAATVTYDMDRVVGTVFSVLNNANIANNTLVIVTSDNGGEYDLENNQMLQPVFFQDNGGLRLRKRFVFQGGVLVPFFAVWPGVIHANKVSYFPTSLYDLRQTFEHLLSLYSSKKSSINDKSFTQTVDSSVSILPILLGGDNNANQVQREYMAVEYCPQNKEQNCKFGFYKTVGWSSSFMKLTYDVTGYNVPNFGEGQPMSLQLFNLTDDPQETNNLIGNPMYRDLVKELQDRRKASRVPLNN